MPDSRGCVVVTCLILAAASTCCGKSTREPVTCGSAIKLVHEETNYELHSHDINYGSGSRQQSVTAHPSTEDSGNLWIIKEAYGHEACVVGEPIPCGSTIRLEHLNTERNLHTHRVQSPLSMQQEISCFQAQELGDSADDWRVVCDETNWNFDRPVRMKNPEIGGFLHSHSQHRFSQQNCPNCPIIGQQEVTCFREMNNQNTWKAKKGLTSLR